MLSTRVYIEAVQKHIRTKLTPLFYSGSTLATALAQLASGVLVVKWIAPSQLGTWQSVKLLQVYAFILLLGVNNGLSRELPFYLGKSNQKLCRELLGSALFAANIASAISVIGIIAGLIIVRPAPVFCGAIIAIGLMIPLTFYQNILLVTYRSRDAFNILTKIQYVEAILSAATIPLVYYFGYVGLLMRPVLTLAVIVALMFKFAPLRVGPHWNSPAAKMLVKTGLPIFGLDYVQTSSGTLDRVLALKFGGVTNVGFYALAALVLQTLQTIPKSLSQYVYPKLSYQLGRSGDTLSLWAIGFRWFLATTILMAASAALGWFALDHLVHSFAPTYVPGLKAAKLILIAGVFEGGSVIANILWSVKAWRLMTAHQILSSVAFIAGPVVASIAMSPSLEAIAIGVVAARAIRCVLAVVFSYFATRGKYLQRYALQGAPQSAT